TYTTAESTGSLAFTPVADQVGTTTITVTVEDGGFDNSLATANDNASFNRTFNVIINPVNDLPTLDAIANLSISEDTGQQTVNLAGITAGVGESQPLRVTATSSNTSLVPNPVITYISDAATGSLAFTPAADQFGTTTITVTVEDGGFDNNLATADDNASFNRTFNVMINPVNDPPTFDSLADLEIDEDASVQTVNLAGITAGVGESQPLRITASSDQTGLIPNPAITYTSEESTGTINFTPVAEQIGAAEITVTVIDAGLDGIAGNDDDASLSRSFHVTVNPVNDAPVMATLPDLTFREDIHIHMNGPKMGDYVTDIDSDIGLISYRIANLDTIDSRFGVSIGMASDSGQFSLRTDNSIHIHPAQDFNGQTTVTIEARDSAGGVSAGQSFVVTITPVNDLPVLSDITYQATENTTFIADANHGLLATATEPDDDDLIIQILASPGHGQLIMGEEGAFSYVPDENYNLTDGFTYRVFDGTGFSNTGMVTFEIATTHPWYNGQEPRDVNNDKLVTALDVVWVINEINITGSHLLSTTRSDGTIEPFLDVSHDGYATPLDALIIINYLNQPASGEGEAPAGETSLTAPVIDLLMSRQASLIKQPGRASTARTANTDSLAQPALDNTPYYQRVDQTLDALMQPARRSQLSDTDADTERDDLFEQSDWLDF
ncbi:MAG: Ig-like domain-containing protein, partial [Pseudomonadales bacterium]|nr:Ig-like domain-containing protein [Pseudomonadales bacterium]